MLNVINDRYKLGIEILYRPHSNDNSLLNQFTIHHYDYGIIRMRVEYKTLLNEVLKLQCQS